MCWKCINVCDVLFGVFCACRSQCSCMSWPAVVLKQVLLMASRWKRSCRSWVRLHMFPPVIYLMWRSSSSAGLWSVSLININTSILMVSRSSKGAVVHRFSFPLSVANKREQKAKKIKKTIIHIWTHNTQLVFCFHSAVISKLK